MELFSAPPQFDARFNPIQLTSTASFHISPKSASSILNHMNFISNTQSSLNSDSFNYFIKFQRFKLFTTAKQARKMFTNRFYRNLDQFSSPFKLYHDVIVHLLWILHRDFFLLFWCNWKSKSWEVSLQKLAEILERFQTDFLNFQTNFHNFHPQPQQTTKISSPSFEISSKIYSTANSVAYTASTSTHWPT